LGSKIQELWEISEGSPVIITQGFIGASESGDTTTLGRGASDYSAALVAEAIDADALLIYKDVEGVYDVDPKKSNNAKLIREISFEEMNGLVLKGAKVLHAGALSVCERKGIPIWIGSTYLEGASGTWVNFEKKEQGCLLAAAI
jgi:aspartate kinase